MSTKIKSLLHWDSLLLSHLFSGKKRKRLVLNCFSFFLTKLEFSVCSLDCMVILTAHIVSHRGLCQCSFFARKSFYELKHVLLSCSAYISTARRLSPSIPRELEEYIASAYSSIRQEEAKSNSPHSYTTIRTLLSILRISAVSLFFLLICLPVDA